MLAKPFCFFQISKLIRIAQGVLILLSILGVCSLLFLMVDHQREGVQQEEMFIRKEETTLLQSLGLEWLGSSRAHESFYAQDLAHSLVYLGKNSRPDASAYQVEYLVGCLGSNERALVKPGQKLYLSYRKDGLRFSQETEPLWIKFKEMQEDMLQYDAGIMLSQEETDELYQEKIQGVAAAKAVETFDDKFFQQSYVQDITQAKWWRPDVFYETYGEVEFEDIKGCHRLELSHDSYQTKSKICFVKPHSLLIFKEGHWEVYKQGIETQPYPMAEILSITPLHMEIKIWDESGIYTKQVSLDPQKIKPWHIKPEEVFLHIRQRTTRQISCKIGEHNLLLREGDWLLHTGNEWKVLKKATEIEKYLALQLEGELFVFEGVEKNQGNTIFKGRLFDTMREQMQVVRIPVVSIKKRKSTKRHMEDKKSIMSEGPQIKKSTVDSTVAAEDELLRLANPQKHHEFSK